jgi:hypothetical protein
MPPKPHKSVEFHCENAIKEMKLRVKCSLNDIANHRGASRLIIIRLSDGTWDACDEASRSFGGNQRTENENRNHLVSGEQEELELKYKELNQSMKTNSD